MNVKVNHPFLIFTMSNSEQGQTIRQFLQQLKLSKKTIHLLYMMKEVTINGEVKSFDTVLKACDELSVLCFKAEGIDFIPQPMKLEIVYEDEHLLVINKPAGIMVHPDTKNGRNTLVNGVASYYESKQYYERIRYIHRIDTDTSGLVIFAKHTLIHPLLDDLLSKKEIKREYIAFVHGILKRSKGLINEPIGRDRHHQARRRVTPSGDQAVTHYEVLHSMGNYSIVNLRLETGRTHQIRVHLSHIGHPLLADELYGGQKPFKTLRRHALHAQTVRLKHPFTQRDLVMTAPIPTDLAPFMPLLSDK